MVIEGTSLGEQQFDIKDFPRPAADETGYMVERKDRRAVYGMTFGVTPAKLMDFSDSFRATGIEQGRDYWQDTIINAMHALAIESLNSTFLPKFFPQETGLFFRYDYSKVPALQQSAKEKAFIAVQNVNAGIISPNEARELLGWNGGPGPGGGGQGRGRRTGGRAAAGAAGGPGEGEAGGRGRRDGEDHPPAGRRAAREGRRRPAGPRCRAGKVPQDHGRQDPAHGAAPPRT